MESKIDCPIQRIESVILLIVKSLHDIKSYVIINGFKNHKDEIYFFKHQKPIIVSKLIYYNAICKIETKM